MQAECIQPTIRAVWQSIHQTVHRLLLECVAAIKALMVMPSLLLQKPFQKSKAKDHKQCLERRLALWTAGDIQSLLQEVTQYRQG